VVSSGYAKPGYHLVLCCGGGGAACNGGADEDEIPSAEEFCFSRWFLLLLDRTLPPPLELRLIVLASADESVQLREQGRPTRVSGREAAPSTRDGRC